MNDEEYTKVIGNHPYIERVGMAETMNEVVAKLLKMPPEEKARRAEEAIKAYAKRRAVKHTESP